MAIDCLEEILLILGCDCWFPIGMADKLGEELGGDGGRGWGYWVVGCGSCEGWG